MDQFVELKNIILEELGKLYPSTIITLWFDKMEILEISGSEVTLSLPESRKLFVEANYATVLKDTFSSVLGVPVEVKILSPKDLEEKKTPVKEPEEKARDAYHTRFNPNYTFDTFIVGKSNQLAQTASMAVAKHPFHLNNPLYLYGRSGLGKTHLLYAIMAKLREDAVSGKKDGGRGFVAVALPSEDTWPLPFYLRRLDARVGYWTTFEELEALAALGRKPDVVAVPAEQGHLVQPLFPHLKNTKRFEMRRRVRIRVFW